MDPAGHSVIADALPGSLAGALGRRAASNPFGTAYV
jgi:hypothetical protein